MVSWDGGNNLYLCIGKLSGLNSCFFAIYFCMKLQRGVGYFLCLKLGLAGSYAFHPPLFSGPHTLFDDSVMLTL